MRRLSFMLAALGLFAVCGTPAIPSTSSVTPLSEEQERALKPKDTFKECDYCPEMVVVPAGSFMMGSAPSEKDRATMRGRNTKSSSSGSSRSASLR